MVIGQSVFFFPFHTCESEVGIIGLFEKEKEKKC
jgi:hypothetical protein